VAATAATSDYTAEWLRPDYAVLLLLLLLLLADVDPLVLYVSQDTVCTLPRPMASCAYKRGCSFLPLISELIVTFSADISFLEGGSGGQTSDLDQPLFRCPE